MRVLLTFADVMADDWHSFELKFLAPEAILEAVVYTDVSYIDSSSAAEERKSWYGAQCDEHALTYAQLSKNPCFPT